MSLSSETAAAMAAAQLVPGQSPEPLRLPDPVRVFAHRVERLRALSPGHGLAAWLDFVAGIAAVQKEIVARPAVAADPEAAWKDDLAALLAAYRPGATGGVAEAADRLAALDGTALDTLAAQLAQGEARGADLALAPFVVAARQVAWTRHAASLDAAALAVTSVHAACPVCGEPPLVGVIHVSKSTDGLRYLHCGNCHTAWHHVRANCVSCGGSGEVSLRFIENGKDDIRAETCDHCHSYLKLLLEPRLRDYDTVADDLASLSLDLLVGDEGYRRIGINPFLVQED